MTHAEPFAVLDAHDAAERARGRAPELLFDRTRKPYYDRTLPVDGG